MSSKEKHLLAFNLGYIAIFGLWAVAERNYEFLFYVSIVVFLILLLLFKYKRLGLSTGAMWLLSIWGLLHMMGGNIPIGDSVLYNLQLIPVLLKYDQFVHAFGFGSTTIVGWQLLRPCLKEKFNWTTISIILVMIGMGAGALNEILEFIATVTIPETNVGGYYNTALDMVFNMIGAIIAVLYLTKKQKKLDK